LLAVLRCAWTLRGFTIAGSAVAMGFTLAGCSYLFVRGVEGSYLATGAPMLGKVIASNESEEMGERLRSARPKGSNARVATAYRR